MRALFVAIVLSAAACGGGSAGGSATLIGTIGGQPLVPRDAVSGTVSFDNNGVPGTAGLIAITSASGLCSLLATGKEPRSTGYLVLTAFQLQPNFSTVPPPAVGTYTIGNGALHGAVAVFATTDNSCQLVPSPGAMAATSGQIDFTSVGSRYAGSYEIRFQSGEQVHGTFDAPGCGAVTALNVGSSALACQ